MEWRSKRLIEVVQKLLEKCAASAGFAIKKVEIEETAPTEPTEPFKTEFPRIRIHLSNKDDETCVYFRSYVYDREEYINVSASTSSTSIVAFGEDEFRGGTPTASAESRMKNFIKKIKKIKH